MKDRKIYCFNKISPAGTSLFREGYELTEELSEAHGILVRSANLFEVEMPESLRAIARAGAGVNNIPIDACSEKGVVVFNTPGANANAVKELVIAALLMCARDITGGIKWVADHIDDPDIAKTAEKAKKEFAGHEIKGRKLGVIGLGAIGVLVANVAVSLGMEVYGYDPYISIGSAWNLKREVHHAEKLTELYEDCDFITVHVPSTPDTRGMINKEALGLMKNGVSVLNFARADLVNEADMAEALSAGKIHRYITDFADPMTVGMKNAIVIPHLGASTEESEENCAVMAVKEIQDYLDNGNITHSVNFPDLDAGVCHTESRIACLHLNIPNMLGQITTVMGEEGINIATLYNKSRDKYAYTLMDIENRITDEALLRLQQSKGMLRVRIVK